MVKIVCNLKGPVLVKLAQEELIDGILLTPKRYDLPESSISIGLSLLPKFFETDYRGNIDPKELAKLHRIYSVPGDYCILPDVALDPERSFTRYKEYLKEYRFCGGTLIFPLQSVSRYELDRIINLAEKHVDNFLIGLPYRVFKHKRSRLFAVVSDLIQRSIGYHLLGFNPTKWPLFLFRQAHSFDSQAIMPYVKKFPSIFFAKRDGSWFEFDGRKFGTLPLDLETRLVIFHKQLRSWLSIEPENHSLEHFLELEVKEWD